MRSGLAVFVVFAIGCAAAHPCPPVAVAVSAQPFLWDVRGSHGSITLFGSHQLATRDDIPDAAFAALDHAELFVVEASEGGQTDTIESGTGWREALDLQRGLSLQRMMTDNDFMNLRERLDISAGRLSRTRPWVALAMLIKTVFEFPDPNMATILFEHALARRVRMEFLDTWEQQTMFLDMTVGVDDLEGALHTQDLACSVADNIARYRAQDERSFYTKGNAASAGPPAFADPESSAIYARSVGWTEKIARYANSGKRVFVAIGVANIVGPGGIASRLTAAGFTVTRK